MNKKKLIKFCKKWNKTNKYYYKITNNHLSFPEPILKEIIKIKFDLSNNNSGSYDFDGEIELKSVTKENGNTPYQFSEKDCKRIIYCEVLNGKINVYEISKTKVDEINEIIKQKELAYQSGNIKTPFANLTTGKYKDEITNVYDLKKGTWNI